MGKSQAMQVQVQNQCSDGGKSQALPSRMTPLAHLRLSFLEPHPASNPASSFPTSLLLSSAKTSAFLKVPTTLNPAPVLLQYYRLPWTLLRSDLCLPKIIGHGSNLRISEIGGLLEPCICDAAKGLPCACARGLIVER